MFEECKKRKGSGGNHQEEIAIMAQRRFSPSEKRRAVPASVGILVRDAADPAEVAPIEIHVRVTIVLVVKAVMAPTQLSRPL